MKNVLPHDVRTLIIAGIVATIIPTPIDFNNLIIFMRGFKSPESALLLRMFVYESCSIPQRNAKSHKQEQTIALFNILFS